MTLASEPAGYRSNRGTLPAFARPACDNSARPCSRLAWQASSLLQGPSAWWQNTDSYGFHGGSCQSPGTGAGVAGTAPPSDSLLAPDHFSTIKKIAGTKKIPITLAAIIPPITVVPMIC